MIQPAFEILNQRGTPMFFSDVFANRPTAGIVGRIFISTDTYAFYRDTGSGWDLIGGPGSGTITGSGTIGTLPIWNGTQVIGDSSLLEGASKFTTTKDFQADGYYLSGMTAGSGALYWTSDRVTLANYNPTGDVHIEVAGGQAAQVVLGSNLSTTFYGNIIRNGGLSTQFLKADGSLDSSSYVTTNIYNGNGTLSGNRVVTLNSNYLSFAGGQTYIGSQTASSGLLTINNASADAHLQVVGASAPSIRIDNAGTGATQRLVFGLATATNNFIQGSTAGDICISTASSSPLLFGMWQTINASEVMRITTSNNLLIGRTTDAGYKLDVNGSGAFRASATLNMFVADNSNWSFIQNTGTNSGTNSLGFFVSGATADLFISPAGRIGIGTINPQYKLQINSASSGFTSVAVIADNSTGNSVTNLLLQNASSTESAGTGVNLNFSGVTNWMGRINTAFVGSTGSGNANMTFYVPSLGSLYSRMTLDYAGNLGLGVTPSAWSLLNAFDFGNTGSSFLGGSLSVYQNNINLTSNGYYNGGWKYKNTNPATNYEQSGGWHYWYNAISGTAGNTISFNSVMALTPNSNILVNTLTDAGYKLDVIGDIRALTNGGGDNNSLFEGNGSFLKVKGRASYAALIIDGTGTNNWEWAIRGETTLRLNENGNNRICIASGGNFGINVTTPTSKLHLSGTLRVDGQTAATAGGSSGQHLIINCDGTTYKIALLNN